MLGLLMLLNIPRRGQIPEWVPSPQPVVRRPRPANREQRVWSVECDEGEGRREGEKSARAKVRTHTQR